LDPEELLQKKYIWTTLMISMLVLSSSAAGIFVGGTYARDTTTWAEQARAQDVADVVGVCVLLLSAYGARKGSVRGFQAWAGALLFIIYTFAIYSFASAFNSLFLIYVAALGLSTYTFIGGVLLLDFEVIKGFGPIGPRVRVLLGALLVVLGLGFAALWLSQDVPAIVGGTVPTAVSQAGLLTNPIHVLDLAFYLPALVISGTSLLRDGTLGHVFSLPLLLFSVLEGLGILLIFVI
jgi:hypothetical protein